MSKKKEKEKGTGPVPKADASELEDAPVVGRAHAETIEPPSDRKTAETPALPDTRPTAKVDPADLDEGPARELAKKEPPVVTAESPRARTMTLQPGAALPVSRAPDMPTTIPPINVSMGGVEDPTNMPGPLAIPGGHPTDPAAAPGHVPRGDSRSLRNAATNEFALIYRQATFVITRTGLVGTRGTWRVVEYPTSPSASHAYAKECSRFVSEGFSDYRG